MTETKFSIGDPVWSKMKGYCPWPSRIAHPSESTLKKPAADKLKNPKVHHLVFFFGSKNFAWMPEDTIKPYDEFKEKNKNGAKSVQFKQGLKQVEEYITSGGKATLAHLIADDAAIENITNNDFANSPSAAGDSLSNDASNIDGDLPSIDEEIAVINNKKPASSSTVSKKLKNSHDSHNDSSSLTSPVPSSVQKDYSRTPFKSRKTTKLEEPATEITSPTKRVRTSDDDSYGTSSLSSPTISTTITTSRPPTSKTGARNVLLRASQYPDGSTVETPQINMSFVSAKSKTIRASTLKFGFIGLGFLGQRLLKNLLNSGHQVSIWNRSPSKCKEFLEAGATHSKTPADVVNAADIIFSCLSDPKASKETVFGTFGILTAMNQTKGLVEISSIDPETSNDISEAIISRGGRYLEAPPIGNGRKAAEDGELTFVASGDKTLYEDCSSCFQAMGRKAFFLGHQAGFATRMNLIMSMLYGTVVSAITECCTLIERAELPMTDFREILKLSPMNCTLGDSVVDKLASNDSTISMPLNRLQKDLRLMLNMAEEYDQTCPIAAIVNEIFKAAKRSGFEEHDVTGVYHRIRF